MKLRGEHEIVTPDKAAEWIQRNIAGRITKEDLDQNRHKEVNGLDMMQNSCIAYHSESILETQIICLIFVFIIEEKLHWAHSGGNEDNGENKYICIVLIVEHFFSYISTYYRKYEIQQRGEPDVNGILCARNESYLRTLEIFVDCLIFGYIIKFFMDIGFAERHNQPFYFYWIIIDCLIMFCSLPYNYFSQLMRI